MPPRFPLDDLGKKLVLPQSEADWQNKTVIPMAQWGGWKVAHTSDSRKQVRTAGGGTKTVGDKKIKGYPDLTLVHPRHGVVIAELKREDGWEWREGQREWLDQIAEVAMAQRDWAIAAAAQLGPDVVDALGPMPRVYAALWRPGDVDMVEDVLIRHQFDAATWWPDHRR